MIYKRKNLSNGVKLVTLRRLSTQAVTISAYIKAGFRFDPVSKPGLAHFTEHMAFSKTKSFENSQVLARAIEQYGGWHLAFTWIDYQNHIVHLPKEHFEIGAKVLSETLFDLVIEDSEVEKERGVVKEEILKNKADPSKAICDYVWFPLFFQGTPLNRPYSGNIEDIDKIKREDVRPFLDANFIPQNIVLFVAGDKDDKEISEVVDKYFGRSIKQQKHDKEIPSLISDHKKRLLVVRDDSYYQSSVVVGIKTVPFSSKMKYIFEIIKEMIGGYFGASLIYKLREGGGLIYTWNAFQDNLIDTGYLLINVSVAHKNVKKVARIIVGEFMRIGEGKFLEEEFATAKNHLIGNLLSNTERGRDYIRLYALQELLDPTGFKDLDELINTYQGITMQDVKNAADEFLKKENVFIGSIGQIKEKDLSDVL